MDNSRMSRILDIFLNFFKFGCFTFGGGWGIVAQIQKEYVEKKHWITEEELLDFTSVGRSLPGLMIGNASMLFGYQTAGITGAVAALLGITIPPVAIMIGVTFVYGMIKDNVYAARAMMGVRASVVPIIFSALVRLFKPAMKEDCIFDKTENTSDDQSDGFCGECIFATTFVPASSFPVLFVLPG